MAAAEPSKPDTGRWGAAVYMGQSFDGQVFASKVVPQEVSLVSYDVYHLFKVNHVNVVKLYHVEDEKSPETNTYIRTFVLDWAEATLADAFRPANDPKKYLGPLPDDIHGLNQLSKGLHHIHSLGLVHRSIKPSNVLIHFNKRYDPSVPIFQWSDFGLTKSVTDPDASLQKYPINLILKEENWMAPETLLWRLGNTRERKITAKSDVFVAGMLFFYFLCKGLHAFGFDYFTINNNILQGNPSNIQQLQEFIPLGIIKNMLAQNPGDRITMEKAVQVFTETVHNWLLHLCSLENPSPEDMNSLVKVLSSTEDDIDINQANPDGLTPLMLVCARNRSKDILNCLEILVAAGNRFQTPVNINHRDLEGNNGFLHLCRTNYSHHRFLDVVKLLVQFGMDLNVQEELKGWSAFHYLLVKCYGFDNFLDIIRTLVEDGMRVDLKCKRGSSALDYIREIYPHWLFTEPKTIELADFIISASKQ